MLTDTDGPPRPLVVATSLVPGLGQALLGRPRRGLLHFMIATGTANLALLSVAAPIGPLGETSFLVGVGLTAAIVSWSVLDAWWIGVGLRRPPARSFRAARIAEAEAALAASDRGAARRALFQILEQDRGDPAARVLLSGLERGAGRPDVAREHARAGLAATRRSRFQSALEREAALAREARSGR